MSEKRIVSLSPHATEIVCALGLKNLLVGVSHDCDFPASVAHIPSCTEAKVTIEKLNASATPFADTLIRDSLSMYRVLPGQLNALEPDIIITQIPDEASTIPTEQLKAALQEGCTSKPTLISLSPKRLSDVAQDFERIATLLDQSELAEVKLSRIRRRMDAITQETSALIGKPTVACVEWLNPLMTASKWMPELITMAGGLNIFGKPGQHSAWMSWEDLIREDPDVIIICPMGNDIDTTRTQMQAQINHGDWHNLDAVKEKRTYIIDGKHFCHRPGPRLIETLETIAEILHPETFYFGHKKRGWENF